MLLLRLHGRLDNDFETEIEFSEMVVVFCAFSAGTDRIGALCSLLIGVEL